MKGKVSISKDLCKGCEYCIRACPVHILRLSHKTNIHSYHYAEVTDMKACTGCRACALVCPDAAIEVWKEKKS